VRIPNARFDATGVAAIYWCAFGQPIAAVLCGAAGSRKAAPATAAKWLKTAVIPGLSDLDTPDSRG